MSGELDMDQTWVGAVAPGRMATHGEEYGSVVSALGQGGASWGEVGLVAECAAALQLSGQYLREVFDGLAPTLTSTGEDLRTAAERTAEAETVSRDTARRLADRMEA